MDLECLNFAGRRNGIPILKLFLGFTQILAILTIWVRAIGLITLRFMCGNGIWLRCHVPSPWDARLERRWLFGRLNSVPARCHFRYELKAHLLVLGYA